MHLLDSLFPPREDERALRDMRVDEFAALLTPRLATATRPATVALLPFDNPSVRAALHEAKYHGSMHAFALLSSSLADFLPDYLAENGFMRQDISLVPLPLGKVRRKERGYNQVEEVARRALKGLCAADTRITLDTALLERIRETPTQVSLTREAREENMKGAFGATHPPAEGRLYILLDDVLTTGATLQSALDTLITAGFSPERLLPIALAH